VSARIGAVLAAVAMIAVAGCGGDEGPSSDARDAFVEAKASSLCAVRSQKFRDESEQSAAVLSALDAADLSGEDRTTLAERYETDSTLRAAVTERVAATCP
jgi:hypothetical protein